MPRSYYVYILASRSRKLYVGVTNDLSARLAQHRAGGSSHTARYRIGRLVHVETSTDIRAAIAREKQIKAWSREKKLALVESTNRAWDDLMPGNESFGDPTKKQIPRYARDDELSGEIAPESSPSLRPG